MPSNYNPEELKKLATLFAQSLQYTPANGDPLYMKVWIANNRLHFGCLTAESSKQIDKVLTEGMN
jgi:hypothetical protein